MLLSGSIVLIGTFDSKGEEFAYLRGCLLSSSHRVITVNVGTKASTTLFPVDYEAKTVLEELGEETSSDRGQALERMSKAVEVFIKKLYQKIHFHGIIGAGGTGGTSVVTAAMRALPFHVAKVCLSTVGGSEMMAQYQGGSNIVVVPTIVDIAGLNRISTYQLSTAAHVICGMVTGNLATVRPAESKPIILASMFGNTTDCVNNAQKILDTEGYEVLVFHAIGTGGKSLEASLELDGQLVSGVLDITTTEWADELCGGVFSAGPQRLDGPGQLGVPHLIVPGCLDMVNFGAMDTVPEKYRSDSTRKFHKWNPSVTLMRTNVDENKQLGEILAKKANAAKGPVAFLLPKKGISILDADGGLFCDREADEALFKAIKDNANPSIPIYEMDNNINDVEFSKRAVEVLLQLIAQVKKETEKEKESKEKAKEKEKREWIERLPNELKTPREKVLARLRKAVDEGRPIVGAGAGTGISAKFEEKGGADLIIIYNSGRFRMAGRGSLAGILAYKDANAVVLEMADEVLPVVKDVPVLAGVCATDPFRNMDKFLKTIKKVGFSGVQNFPTVGLIDGNFRKNLEETGMSYMMEVDMIRKAKQMGLFTTPYVFNTEEAKWMTEAGADVIVAHMGLTTSGSIGATTALNLDQSVRLIQDITDVAKAINPDVIVLCHGGPISMPDDAEYVLKRTRGVDGFYGASSMERLPVEVAITDQIKQFKNIEF